MSKITDSQRRMIFKLAAEKGLDDETIRAYVHSLTEKVSLKNLTIIDATKVIDSLTGKKQNAGNMITDKQCKYIESLTKELGWLTDKNEPDMSRLNAFIQSKYHISRIEWLTSRKASQVIEGLKAMINRKNKEMAI